VQIHREFLDCACARIGIDVLAATTRPPTDVEVTRATDVV
jgi:hypothetical protein